MQPLISVITPTYNAAGTIERNIKSVVQQIYKNIEFIIVDGHSLDQTLTIVKDAAEHDPRIRYISEKDNGAYDAMNKGIRMSRGKWIYFLGADDLLIDKNIFQELFDKGYFSQDKVFYGNVIIEGETSWARDQEIYAGEFDLARLLEMNICHQAVFYPRPVVEKIGFYNPNFTICADWDYNLRCYAVDSFLYVDQIIARFSGGGLSTVVNEDPFLKNLPGNILRCFNLDPDEPALVLQESPFRKVVLEYHKKSSNYTGGDK
jgi:glycosyltransferase involved in cell wall biosynthesis